MSGAAAALLAAGLLAAACLLALFVRPLRRFLPELALLAVGLAAVGGGMASLSPGNLTAWQHAALHPRSLPLIELAILAMLLRPSDIGEATASNAVLAGFLVGWFAAVPALVRQGGDPRRAARLALLAVAGGALSPLGGPVPAVAVAQSAPWTLWAAIPCLAAVLVAWPPDEQVRRPTLPLRVVIPGVLGVVTGWLFGPTIGLATAIVGLTVGRATSASVDGPGFDLHTLFPLRLALAAWLAATLLHVGGAAWFGHWVLGKLSTEGVGPAGLAVGATAVGWLLDPWLTAAYIDRIRFVSGTQPGGLWELCLPLALSPVPALVLAAQVHGREVFRAAAPPGLVTALVAIGWIALVG